MSLYNKYRPMDWQSVIGQDGISETLKNAVASGELSSTYLFHGPRGTGKTTCARIFAKALNCENPVAPGVPCAKCDNCVDISNDNSPFVVELDAACFQRDVRVRLANGKSVRIGELVDKKMNVEVLSYNLEKGRVEPRKVIGWHKNGSSREFYNVKLNSGYGERRSVPGVTMNHQFYDVNCNKKELREFKIGDSLLFQCPTYNDIQLNILAGTLLGDSSLIGGRFRGKDDTNVNVVLQFAHNITNQEDYLYYKSDLLKSIGGSVDDKIYKSGYGGKFKRFSSYRNEYLSRIKDEWYGGNKKKITEKWLSYINEISLAFWYMDDGTLSDPEGKSALRLYTNGKTELEVDNLICFLNKKWGFDAYKSKDNRRDNQYYISIGRAGGKVFFELIKKYVCKSMDYKLPEFYRYFFDKGIYNCGHGGKNLISVKIMDIVPFVKGSKKEKSFKRYDIEVEGNHNYFVGRGVLVSNSNTGVDNMRDLKAAANMVSIGDGWQVYIIDECHMLSKAAQNSGLKMFEESPEKTIFIMATTELHKMAGTIISRSLRFDFRPLGINDIVGRLKFIADSEGMTSDEPALKAISKAGRGSMRDSISILERISLENVKSINIDSVVRSLGITPTEIMIKLGEVIQGNYKEGFGIAERVISDGYDINTFLQGAVDYFRDLIKVKMELRDGLMVEQEVMDNLNKVSGLVHINVMTNALEVLDESIARYRYNDNKQILLEMSLYKVAKGFEDEKKAESIGQTNVYNTVQPVHEQPVQLEVQPVQQPVQEQPVQPEVQMHLISPLVQQQPVIYHDTIHSVPIGDPVETQNPVVVENAPLTDYQRVCNGWQMYISELLNTNQDAGLWLQTGRPKSFDRDELYVEFRTDESFDVKVFNERFAHVSAKVLSGLMQKGVQVKAVIEEPEVDPYAAQEFQLPVYQQPVYQEPIQQPVNQEQQQVQQPAQQAFAPDNIVTYNSPYQQTQSVSQEGQTSPVDAPVGALVTPEFLTATFGNGSDKK